MQIARRCLALSNAFVDEVADAVIGLFKNNVYQFARVDLRWSIIGSGVSRYPGVGELGRKA